MNHIYIMNSLVVEADGEVREATFYIKEINVATAKMLIAGRNVVSAVGHESTARFLSSILGVDVPMNRVVIKYKAGEEAVVIKLEGRLPEGKILSEEELKSFPFRLYYVKRLN